MDQICNNDCAVAKIIGFSKTLADKSATNTDRAQALAFIVHFTGDIHQPLHAAERNHDEGGNTVLVDFLVTPGGPKGHQGNQEKLHAVWDSGILNVIAADENVFVQTIQPQIGQAKAEKAPAQLSPWVHAWARESLDLARSIAYKGVNPPPATTQLGQAYEQAADPVVRMQIARGGFRLASVLNQNLK